MHARWASDTIRIYTEEVFSEQSHLWCIKDARELGNAEADPRKRRLVCHADLDTIRDQLEGIKAKVPRVKKDRAGSSGPFRPAIDKAALALEVARMIDDEGRFVQNVCGDGKVHELICAAGTVDQWRTKCGWAPASRGKFRMRLSAPN